MGALSIPTHPGRRGKGWKRCLLWSQTGDEGLNPPGAGSLFYQALNSDGDGCQLVTVPSGEERTEGSRKEAILLSFLVLFSIEPPFPPIISALLSLTLSLPQFPSSPLLSDHLPKSRHSKLYSFKDVSGLLFPPQTLPQLRRVDVM